MASIYSKVSSSWTSLGLIAKGGLYLYDFFGSIARFPTHNPNESCKFRDSGTPGICSVCVLYIYIYENNVVTTYVLVFFHCQVAEGKWRPHPELPEREDARLCLVNYYLVVFSSVLDLVGVWMFLFAYVVHCYMLRI